jgi:hypothetical protein
MPAPESLNERPEPVPIQKKPVKAAHYGRNIENMLSLIAEREDDEVKNAMIATLAGYMRQQYLIWNKDTVSDETIFQDIERLSDGRIKVPEGLQIVRAENRGVNNVQNKGNGQNRGNNRNWQKNQKNRKQHK